MTDTNSTLFGTGEFFQKDNYAPVTDELTEFDLPVEGAIPVELDGWYLRNGPNPRQATAHWFTGDGMIHGVRIEGGRAAWYRNRWVRTDSFDTDFPLYNADGTRNLRASVANTHVVNHAGKTLALVESSLPYEISNDLDTLGAYDFGGKLVDSMTAHPKVCPTTGELHFFGYGSIFAPHVTYHRADANGELTINRPLDVPALTMMHDFALTAGHVVFMDLPLVFNLDVAMTRDRDMPYRWDDNYGARLGVMRRDDPFGEVRWFEIDPCYVFHVANAYETTTADGNSIVLQAVRYPELWRDTGGFETDGVLWSWTIDLRTGLVTERQLGPLFFVWLGASLQVRELGAHPAFILLGLGLGVGALLAHGVGRVFGQPLTLAVLSAAQLGVPVAAATLGTEQHLLAAGEPAALMLGALVTVATTSIASVVAVRRQSADESKAASG
jgi:carotenoid cleavage dioxygenase-like enzyme